MSFDVWSRLHVAAPRYPWGTYGIEVEAERLQRDAAASLMAGDLFAHPLLRAMQTGYWRAITDGSLRHNGVEFITSPVSFDDASRALRSLYAAMDEGLFAPSVRTGIHVHINASTMNNEQMLNFMRAYVVLEPLLFRTVGAEREQNIYCVPLYRADNERRLWNKLANELLSPRVDRATLMRIQGVFRSFCKYSALNFESFLRLGTFEFRHAPTWGRLDEAQRWLRLVREVAHFTMPAGATLDDLSSARTWATELVPALRWSEYLREVEARGLLDFANGLQPFTYKVAEWGRPAGMAFGRGAGRARADRSEELEPTLRRTPPGQFEELILAEMQQQLDEQDNFEEVE
jgi:hypothetical protein